MTTVPSKIPASNKAELKDRIVRGSYAGIPFPLCAAAMDQIEELGCQIEYVAFCGYVQAQPSLMIPQQQQAVPSYTLFVKRYFAAGEETVFPKLEFKPQ